MRYECCAGDEVLLEDEVQAHEDQHDLQRGADGVHKAVADDARDAADQGVKRCNEKKQGEETRSGKSTGAME